MSNCVCVCVTIFKWNFHTFLVHLPLYTHAHIHTPQNTRQYHFSRRMKNELFCLLSHTHTYKTCLPNYTYNVRVYTKKSYWSYVIVESWQIFSLQRFIWCVLLFLSVFRVTWQCYARFVLNFRFLLKYTFITFIHTHIHRQYHDIILFVRNYTCRRNIIWNKIFFKDLLCVYVHTTKKKEWKWY